LFFWIGYRYAALKTVRASADGLQVTGLFASRFEVPYRRIATIRQSFFHRTPAGPMITVSYSKASGNTGKFRFVSRFVPLLARPSKVHPDVAWLRETVERAREEGALGGPWVRGGCAVTPCEY